MIKSNIIIIKEYLDILPRQPIVRNPTIHEMRRERKKRRQNMIREHESKIPMYNPVGENLPDVEKIKHTGNALIFSPHLGEKWKDLQQKYIEENTYVSCKYIPTFVQNGIRHLRALGRILDRVRDMAKIGDLIIVLDSDTLPISRTWIEDTVKFLDDNYEFVAVQRLENPYDYRFIAHPCFCAWYHGRDIVFKEIKSNPYIEGWERRRWKKIHRTNSLNFHQQLFAIYGDMVYHHGAGSRNVTNQRFFREDLRTNPEFFFDHPEAFIKKMM